MPLIQEHHEIMLLTQDHYEMLCEWARKSATDEQGKVALDELLRAIEVANDITRYSLCVRWQEARAKMPPTDCFPRKWPPEYEGTITRYDRPICKADVVQFVNGRAAAPVGILVTPDPVGVYGWSQLDVYFK